MNLYGRLIWIWLCALCAKPFQNPLQKSIVSFRVWPHDCDFNWHINNGRYLTLMDLGRFDLLMRLKLGRFMLKGWTPLLSGSKIAYFKELRLWSRFKIETKLVAWHGSYFVMEQNFFISQRSDGKKILAAKAYVKGGFYDKKQKKFVSVEDVFTQAGFEIPLEPNFHDDLKSFIRLTEGVKESYKRNQNHIN